MAKPELFLFVSTEDRYGTFYVTASLAHVADRTDPYVSYGDEYNWTSLNNGEVKDFKLQAHYDVDSKRLYTHSTWDGSFYSNMYSPSIREMEAKVKFAKKLVKRITELNNLNGPAEDFATFVFRVAQAIGCGVVIRDTDYTLNMRWCDNVGTLEYWVNKQVTDKYGPNAFGDKENS